MVIREESFSTASELFKFFQDHPNNWFNTSNVLNTFTPGQGYYIFRGQADSRWELCPTAFRSPDIFKKYSPQSSGNFNGDDHKKWLGWHLKAEERSVFLFLEAADKLGIETPISYTDLYEHSKLINNLLKEKKFNEKAEFPVPRALEKFALAQHHGIPTRLLDWTESPLVACFFAAYSTSKAIHGEQKKKPEHVAIYCFHVEKLKKSENITLINAPRHRNNFLRVQKGLFTYMPKANQFFIENNHWPSVEDIVEKDSDLNGALIKCTLPATESDELLKILFDYDVTKYHLMPTLDNIADSVNYRLKLFP